MGYSTVLFLAVLALTVFALAEKVNHSETPPKKHGTWSFTQMKCELANRVLKVSRRIKLLLKCEKALGTQEEAESSGHKKVTTAVPIEGTREEPTEVRTGSVPKPKPLKAEIGELVQELPPVTGSFAEFLYKNLVIDDKDDVNIAVSPLSLEVVLGSAGLGATEQTQDEIYRVLQVTRDSILINYRNKIHELDLKTIDSVKMATRVYLEKTTFPFNEQFKTYLKDVFDTEIEPADFKSGSANEITRINKFVEDQTDKNIKDAVTIEDVNAEVDILFLNTLYFKNKWDLEFDKSQGINLPFLLLNKPPIQATYMTRKEDYSYFKEVPEGKFKMMEMPYVYTKATGQFSMIIILPDEVGGLAEVERFITQDDKWLQEFNLKTAKHTARVKPIIPRFTIDTRIDLKLTLNQMGVTSMFEDKADFRGISTKKKLKIPRIQQRVFIDVDEHGTKAAAATTASTNEVKDVDNTKPIVFFANHPFAFAIIQRTTKTVLFMGHVVKPNYDSNFAPEEDSIKNTA